MTDAGMSTQEFVKDERYDRFHEGPQGDEPVTWWDYEGGRWIVSGYEAVCAAARDPETFSSRHELPNGGSPYAGVMVPSTPVRAVPIEIDPPLHQEYRKLLNNRFGPGAVRKLAPRFLEYTDWCIDEFIESGRADLFHGLAKLVPAMTTLHLLGLPVEDAEIFADAVHVRGEDRFELNSAWSLLLTRTTQTVVARRQKPEDDLVSYLLASEVDGRKFTDMELVEICFTFVIGGMATTARLALGALSYLAAHPDRRAALVADPSRLPAAMEEFLRYYSPVPFLSRTATKDVCFYGKDIKAGDRVAIAYAAANRDPAVFEEPKAVRMDRSPNRHVGLGHGAHFCIGGSLGKSEATTMVQQVLARIPDYRIVEDNWRAEDGKERPAPNWEARISRGLEVGFTPGARLGTSSFTLNSLS
ncbi:cytochrome P450 [Actinacidiphila reveromycinica]|nr:cytochrome P450 [Streptomyces sp. SN-593]